MSISCKSPRVLPVTAALITAFFPHLLLAQDAAGQTGAATKLDPPVKSVVTGKFVGNEKPSQLKFVVVEAREPFSDEETIRLIFTEKNPATTKSPSFDAGFGKLGSALILSVKYSGGIFGCEVAHSAHSKSPFSALGKIRMEEFTMKGGNVSGHVTTGGTLDAFGQTWEVDLTFAAPLPDKLRNPAAAGEKPAEKKPSRESTKSAPDLSVPPAAPGPRIAASSLPLPKDATDVQFKELVKQIQFTSARPVDVVANEFSARLKEQGWKEGRGGLVNKKSAILMREQGAAKLTIMMKPVATGTVVNIISEGLDFSGTNAGKPATPSAPTEPGGSAAGIESQVDQLLKDALKGLPKGL